MDEKSSVGGWSLPQNTLEGDGQLEGAWLQDGLTPEAIKRQRGDELYATLRRSQKRDEIRAVSNIVFGIILQSSFTAILVAATSVLIAGAIWISHQ
jgi:hypothetical protein